jgi:hypothetical protein
MSTLKYNKKLENKLKAKLNLTITMIMITVNTEVLCDIM